MPNEVFSRQTADEPEQQGKGNSGELTDSSKDHAPGPAKDKGKGDDAKKNEEKLTVELAKAKASIESTIEYLRGEHGPEEWNNGMHPEIPEHETLNNPYTYRDDVSAWKESD